MWTPRWSRRRFRVPLAASLLAGALLGCVETGTATTRVDEAELEIEQLVDAITQELALEVTIDEPLGDRTRCERPGLGEGASNALSRRGPIPDVDDPIGRSAALLTEAGYQLVDADELEDGVFGRRDGIRITVVEDTPTGELAIDASTGCRPLPAR